MRYLSIVLFSVLIISCSKNGNDQFLSVSDNFFDLPNQTGTIFVDISSNSKWEVRSNVDWINVIPNRGNGSSKLTISIQSNYLNPSRQGILSVIFDGDRKQNNVNNDIVIIQSLPRIENYQKVIDSLYVYTYSTHGGMDRFGQKAIDYALDCLSEDFYPTERGYNWFVSWYQYREHRDVSSSNLKFVWDYYYGIIERCNNIISNIDSVNVYDNQLIERDYLKSQSLILRAHSYYMLVQLFAERYNYEAGENTHLGVPLKLKAKNESIARETVEKTYLFIKNDLQLSINLLENIHNVSTSASMITINCAYAISARVALTTGDWENATLYAKKAYEGKVLENDYAYGFNRISTEWIWGAEIPRTFQATYGTFFSHIDPYFEGFATLGNQKILSLDVFNFMQDTDIRKKLFVEHYTKQRVGIKFTGRGDLINDYLYIKAGEMYLIEAEAEARRGNDSPAQTVLFSLISKRDPAYVKSTLTGKALIDHIIMHRRADLWGEGQRFLDIKRLNKGMDRRGLGHNETLWNAASNFPAGDKNFVFLIPKQEIDANPNMVQNPL